MAIPTFQSFSTYNASGLNPTTYSPNMLGGGAWVANDILVFIWEDDNTGTLTGVSGGSETWSQHPGFPQASSAGTRLHVWWARCSQTNPTAPTASYSSAPNHCVGAVCAIRGCHTSGNPWDVYNSGNNAAANATIPGASTTVIDCLVLILCSSGFNGTSSTRFSAWTNANLGSLTEQFDQVDTTGNGGGFGAATGTRGSTGDYGSTTVTEAFAGHGYGTIAFKPPQAVNANVTPTTVIGASTIPSPTASGSASVTPAAVLVTATIPTPTVVAGTDVSITTTPVVVLGAVQTPTVVGNAHAPPAAVVAIATTPTPTVQASAAIVAGPVSSAAVVPTPTVEATSPNADVHPDPVVATASVLSPTVEADANVTFLDKPIVTATPITQTRIDLSWAAITGASSYLIEREGTVIDTSGTNSYSDTSCLPATTYHYRVKAVD